MILTLPAPKTRILVPWVENPKTGGVMSNRAGEHLTAKLIMPEEGINLGGLTPRPGQTWLCEVTRITKPSSRARGAILVNPLSMQIDCRFDNVWIEPEQAQVISAILQHPEKNLFLEGLNGVGKTTIAAAIAERHGWMFEPIEGSQIQKYNYLYGRTQQGLTPNGQLRFEWVDSPLPTVIKKAIQFPDSVFLVMFDEYTRIDTDARAVLLPVIAGKHRMLQTPKPEILMVPPNMRWMAAGNRGAGFSLKEEDKANNDRWVVVEVHHMPYEQELTHCLKMYTNAPPDEMERALKIIHSLRKIGPTIMRLTNTPSTRAAENVAMLLSEGISVKTALLTAVANQFDGPTTEPTTQRARVAQKVQAALDGRDIEREN